MDTAITNPPSQNDNIHSPFFLHSGDHPGLVLVSHVLTGANYNTWNRAMHMALNAKNKLGFVDGSLQKPSTDDSNAGVWSRCNSMVISWLLNAVSKEIADSLFYLDTAQAVWSDLKDRFEQSNAPRVFQLKQQLTTLSQGSLDVNSYFTKLKILWDELRNYQPVLACECGGMKAWLDYQQTEYVLQFLMGLNDSYAAIRGQILMIDPLPSVSKVFNLVVQEERQRMINPGVPTLSDSMAFSVSSPSLSPPAMAAATPLLNRGRKDRPTCTHCGLTGHKIDKCYKLHGYPPGYQFRPRQAQGPVQQSVVTKSKEGNRMQSTANLAVTSAGAVPPAGDLTGNQIQQMIAYLSTQLRSHAQNTPEDSTVSSFDPVLSHVSGPGSGFDDWEG